MHITVVICTRDRGDQVLSAVRSVLSQDTDDYDVVIVDQSASDTTQAALSAAGLDGGAKLSYRRSATVGASRARNEGVSLAAGSVVAFTDDDCVVPGDWLRHIGAQFAASADLAAFFGSLDRAPDITSGWVPDFQPIREGPVERTLDVVRHLGLSANFAVRRSAYAALRGFDEFLGAGARFHAAEDTDFGYRALVLGLRVAVAAEPAVVHYGVRIGSEASNAGERYLTGMAAMCMKHARCGDALMARVLARELRRWLQSGTAHLVRGRRPTGYRAASAIARTAAASFGLGLDVRHRLYRPRGRPERAAS